MISTKNLFWEEIFPLFKLAGNGSSNFLHGQTSCDVHGLKSENLIRTCWLSPTGRLKALLEIRFVKQDIEFIILGGNIEELLDGFKKVIFPSDCVEVKPVGEIKRLHEISYTKSWKTSTCKWLPIQNLADNSLDVYKLASKQEIEEWRIRQGIPIGLKELKS